MRTHHWLILILVALFAAACGPTPEPMPETPTPIPATAVEGTLVPPADGVTVAGRGVALCSLRDEADVEAITCTMDGPVTYADDDGSFRFEDVTPGEYLLIYDAARGTFGAALADWVGETLRPGDWPWLRDQFLELAEGDEVSVHMPGELSRAGAISRGLYGTHTLMLGDSPFVIAHTVAPDDDRQLALLAVGVEPFETTTLSVTAYTPGAVNLAAERERLGLLTREELAIIDRGLADRWMRFMAGEDAAYRPLDAYVIEAVRAGDVHEIGAAYFTAIETLGDQLIAAPGYTTIDVGSGQSEVIAWLDESTGDVIETRTGYRHNVMDGPGVWTESGSQGQRFYHYGFSYYRAWDQILPDPVIALIEDFYTEGVAHVDFYMADYRLAAASFQGEIGQFPWYAGILELMRDWQPTPPPFVHLPDSGTVDIRRERFAQAVNNGLVVVDEESVEDFLSSDAARSSAFNGRPTEQEVIDALLTPYRSGRLFGDLEAAIILAATYGGDDDTPLTIRISTRLDQGFLVPRRRDKEILVSPTELVDVLLGYPGALNSRWAHEMGHVVDFRATQYTFERGPALGSRCEPVKYLMEFMWWVQRYPGDAPDWDWMPINSGLTLVRLLTGEYHNSRC